MAENLGIPVFGGTEYMNNPSIPSAVSFADWMKIVHYYLDNAPETLKVAGPAEPVSRSWSIFKVKTPAQSHYSYSKTTVVKVDTATDYIYSSDAVTALLYRWNNKLELVDSFQQNSPLVSASFFDDLSGNHQGLFTAVGEMRPHDNNKGSLVQFDLNNDSAHTIVSSLPRPVFSIAADFNNDRLQDYAVCGFGHTSGGLYWYQQLADGSFKKNVITETPGAMQAITGDFNKDGYTDLMVLFAQAQESVQLYLNNRKGGFSMSKLLAFPPVYGSTSFQLADINKDGLPDILYTCGDNADLTQEFKPYHGVYIFLNKGNWKFEQAYFYHMNGCTKAVAADFDGDGMTDIAAIAFFADFRNHPEEKFLYFRQDAPLHFQTFSPPIETYGRWLCMDVADYDRDGDPDIILGNYAAFISINKRYAPNWDMHRPMIVLENTSH